MPDVPSDLSIKQYIKSDDCQSVTIGWLPARSYTDLWYCVYVQEYRHSNSVDFSVKPDQCGLSYVKSRRRNIGGYRRKTRCYVGEKEYVINIGLRLLIYQIWCILMMKICVLFSRKVSTEKILKLKSSTTYVIQVTVAKPRGGILSYDLLKLDTNNCGLN